MDRLTRQHHLQVSVQCLYVFRIGQHRAFKAELQHSSLFVDWSDGTRTCPSCR